ncbi:MAG: hypothetical protein IJ719_09685 [Clostridia bacterium]|nr:hypothetical protein [Clostridia bacterium]
MDNTLERIIALMNELKIQDQEMIEYLGLPCGTFSNWKRGRGKSYYEHIDRIADRLNVTIDFLFRGNTGELGNMARGGRRTDSIIQKPYSGKTCTDCTNCKIVEYLIRNNSQRRNI